MLPASELLSPKGRLNAAALWPGVDLDVVVGIVGEYLTEGYVKAPGLDEAARQWAYYRAWIQKYDDLSSLPSDVSSAEEGSAAYSQAQIDSWKLRADEALEAFEEVVAGAAGEEGGYAVITSLR